uniref:VQ domain-containing protein n=1 Tax=Davidia involucrata TaxID=16924 RepID=A0A5B6YRJ8_DAVIN
MDSGNSGSMQSSSTGDEEYDSRTESISPFLNPSGHYGSISNPQPPPAPPPLSHHQSHPSYTLFDPPPHNNLGAFSQSPPNPDANTLYNLDLVWSRGLRSDPNYTDLGNLIGLSSSSSSSQSLLGSQLPSQGPFPGSSSVPIRSIHGNGGRDTHTPQTDAGKNSKKRTRASRRAPTTVLTTDTSNFRQMVQEFTGIPAPPFSASPYSRRLDLFGRSGHLETLGPLYPLRPSVQKVQSTTNNTITTSIAGTTNAAFNSGNYRLPSDLGLVPKQPQNMLSMQNPFQSPLPPPFKFPLANAPPPPPAVFGSKSQGNSTIPSLDEFEHVNAVFPSQAAAGRNNNLTRWRDEEAASNNGGQDQQLGSFDGNSHHHHHHHHHVSGYKLNCSASTSEFHPEKGLEINVSSRGEGTVDSWICPSD